MTPLSVNNHDRNTPAPPFHDLVSEITGSMVLPGEQLYDEARAVYNAMIDRRPAAIVKCADAVDVAACVRFASRHGIDLAVRGGGHSAGGLSVWDDALVSICPRSVARRWILRGIQSRSRVALRGRTSIAPPWHTAWPRRLVSSPLRGSAV